MILDPLAQWLQSREIATALRESALAYPIVMTGHFTGMALFGGMILMTDMRLLGWAMKSWPVADVVRQLRPWKWAGFVLVPACGSMLAWSKADKYSGNPYFLAKMTFLALVGIHALVFRRSVYNNAEIDRAPAMPGQAKLAAALSLFLWTGLVSFGRLIAYWE